VLTLPRVAGSIVTGSPIPVEPPDATTEETPTTNGTTAAKPASHHPGSILALRGRRG
jgi:hypothetical protein